MCFHFRFAHFPQLSLIKKTSEEDEGSEVVRRRFWKCRREFFQITTGRNLAESDVPEEKKEKQGGD